MEMSLEFENNSVTKIHYRLSPIWKLQTTIYFNLGRIGKNYEKRFFNPRSQRLKYMCSQRLTMYRCSYEQKNYTPVVWNSQNETLMWKIARLSITLILRRNLLPRDKLYYIRGYLKLSGSQCQFTLYLIYIHKILWQEVIHYIVLLKKIRIKNRRPYSEISQRPN